MKRLGEKKGVVLTGDLNCAHQELDIHSPKTNLRSAGFTQVWALLWPPLLQLTHPQQPAVGGLHCAPCCSRPPLCCPAAAEWSTRRCTWRPAAPRRRSATALAPTCWGSAAWWTPSAASTRGWWPTPTGGEPGRAGATATWHCAVLLQLGVRSSGGTLPSLFIAHLPPPPCRYRFNLRAKNKGWRLDYFLVSEPLYSERVHECYHAYDVMGSDHCPLVLVLRP